MERWLCGWPWEERSSRWCEDHRRPLIYREKVERRYFRDFQSSEYNHIIIKYFVEARRSELQKQNHRLVQNVSFRSLTLER